MLEGVLALLLSVQDVLRDGFTRAGEDKGVVVYKKDDSNAIEVAAEGVIDAPPERVLAALLDYERSKRFAENVAESKILQKTEDRMLVYQRLDLPILEDRDYTLDVRHGRDGSDLWLKFAVANTVGPAARRGVVRVEVNEGGWSLRPVDGGKRTRAFYRLKLDLGGRIPVKMARDRTAKDIPKLFEAIRRLF